MNDNKFSVILTVDTEGHRGDDPEGKLILGQTAEGEFGIAKIMDVCDAYNVKALFFWTLPKPGTMVAIRSKK